MPRTRIDLLMVDRGLAPSRERARALLLAGLYLCRRVSRDRPLVSLPGINWRSLWNRAAN